MERVIGGPVLTRFERVKFHIKRHKTIYITAGVCLGVGVGVGLLIGIRQSTVVVNVAPQINPNISPVFNNAVSPTFGGHSQKVVKCLETGQLWESVTAAAKDANVSMSTMSKVLNGHSNDIGGLHYEIIALGTKEFV